jgi:hypothetical protein
VRAWLMVSPPMDECGESILLDTVEIVWHTSRPDALDLVHDVVGMMKNVRWEREAGNRHGPQLPNPKGG